jgi:antitoxin StbD
MHKIYSDFVTSISEFKKHPMKILNNANGNPVAVLNRNEPIFYCVSPEMLEAFLDVLDDKDLLSVISVRQGEKSIEVDLNDFSSAAT